MGDSRADSEVISVAFGLIADLAAALGVRNISQRGGCWEHAVDDRWWIAVNGRVDRSVPCSHGNAVPAGHCYVEFNGFPAGLFTPFGGMIAAGTVANEETFCAALRAAITLASS